MNKKFKVKWKTKEDESYYSYECDYDSAYKLWYHLKENGWQSWVFVEDENGNIKDMGKEPLEDY